MSKASIEKQAPITKGTILASKGKYTSKGINILRDSLNDFTGTLKISGASSLREISEICQDFLHDNYLNRSFLLDISACSLPIHKIKSLLDALNSPESGNKIHSLISVILPDGTRPSDLITYLELKGFVPSLTDKLIDGIVEYKRSKDIPIITDEETRIVKSCSDYSIYKIDGNRIVLDKNYSGATGIPVKMNSDGTLKSCAHYSVFDRNSRGEYITELYTGDELSPVRLDKEGNAILYRLHQIKRYQRHNDDLFLDEYYGTMSNPIEASPDGKTTLCSSLIRYAVNEDSAPEKVEDVLPFKNSSIRVQENGKIEMKSCSKLIIYKTVSNQKYKFEYIGTKESPISRYKHGEVDSCSQLKRYEIDRFGKYIFTEQYDATSELPLRIDGYGVVALCASLIRPKTIGNKSTFLKYSASRENSIDISKSGNVISCSRIVEYEIIDGASVINKKIMSSSDNPVELNEDGTIKSCSKIISKKTINGQEYIVEYIAPLTTDESQEVTSCFKLKTYRSEDKVLEEEFSGPPGSLILIDKNGSLTTGPGHILTHHGLSDSGLTLETKYSIHSNQSDNIAATNILNQASYSIEGGQKVLQYKYSASQNSPIVIKDSKHRAEAIAMTKDKELDKIVSSCHKYQNSSEVYLGNVLFGERYEGNNTLIKYDSHYRVDQNGKITELNIYDKSHAKIMTFSGSKDNDLLTYQYLDEEDKVAADRGLIVPEEKIKSVTINSNDISSELIDNLIEAFNNKDFKNLVPVSSVNRPQMSTIFESAQMTH